MLDLQDKPAEHKGTAFFWIQCHNKFTSRLSKESEQKDSIQSPVVDISWFTQMSIKAELSTFNFLTNNFDLLWFLVQGRETNLIFGHLLRILVTLTQRHVPLPRRTRYLIFLLTRDTCVTSVNHVYIYIYLYLLDPLKTKGLKTNIGFPTESSKIMG